MCSTANRCRIGLRDDCQIHEPLPFCPNCGKEVQQGLAFCGHCGHKLDTAGAPTQPPSGAPRTHGFVREFRIPIALALLLIGVTIIGVGAGIYAIPGYNQAGNYCAVPNRICDEGRSMIVDGVVLGVVGLIVLVFSGYWLTRHR